MKTALLRRMVGSLCLCGLVFLVQTVLAGSMDTAPYRLDEKWQTSRDLRVPESVLFDDVRQILYVSNIDGTPTEKNGRGFISRVGLDGTIIELKWVTGLNAPKGSALFKNTLYVSDIDDLVAIDVPSGKIKARYPAEGALFLNDVATDADGNVYVSDMSDENSLIYKLANKRMTAWLVSAAINKPNGLCLDRQRLIVGNSGDGCIKAVDLKTKAISTIAKIGSGIDGLRPDGQGNYFISDWQGRTSFVRADGQVSVLLDTRKAKINAADLEYIRNRHLLLIPTFFDNRVVAYEAIRTK